MVLWILVRNHVVLFSLYACVTGMYVQVYISVQYIYKSHIQQFSCTTSMPYLKGMCVSVRKGNHFTINQLVCSYTICFHDDQVLIMWLQVQQNKSDQVTQTCQAFFFRNNICDHSPLSQNQVEQMSVTSYCMRLSVEPCIISW